MNKAIILLSFSILSLAACNQADQSGNRGIGGIFSSQAAKPVAFKLQSGHPDSSQASFVLSGITVSFEQSPDALQTISIRKNEKRLINYIRAVDTAEKMLPTPYMTINGKDTLITFNILEDAFRFKIKDNKATYTKTRDTTARHWPSPKRPATTGQPSLTE
ncbi:hypothetical protein [Chitinophaga qingshengii]|uniref:Lipoprotein n=1 Tax=Chitinophaga qingshengii TaxID=1569794 RepID=A0ABR7TMZ1_9BACT|nr:hypothetical protein [Chitinophaga qingshengii]MBC9930882.1 hypothetical protein [Chitinophaga qingshengii]